MYFISQLSWEWKLFLQNLFACIQFKKIYKSFSVISYFPPSSYLFFVRNPFRMLDRKLQFSKVLFFSQEYSAVFQTDLGIFLCNSANFQNSSQNILYKKPSSFVNLKFLLLQEYSHQPMAKVQYAKCPYSALKMEIFCIVAVEPCKQFKSNKTNVECEIKIMCKNRVQNNKNISDLPRSQSHTFIFR